MGRKKLDFSCKYCGENTELMEKPVYVESFKGHFCDLNCYLEVRKKEETLNENGN